MSSSSCVGKIVKVDLNNYVSKSDLFAEIQKRSISLVIKENPYLKQPFECLIALRSVVRCFYGPISEEYDFMEHCLDVVSSGSFVGPFPQAVQL